MLRSLLERGCSYFVIGGSVCGPWFTLTSAARWVNLSVRVRLGSSGQVLCRKEGVQVLLEMRFFCDSFTYIHLKPAHYPYMNYPINKLWRMFCLCIAVSKRTLLSPLAGSAGQNKICLPWSETLFTTEGFCSGKPYLGEVVGRKCVTIPAHTLNGGWPQTRRMETTRRPIRASVHNFAHCFINWNTFYIHYILR